MPVGWPGGHEDSVLQRAGALLVPTVSAGSRQPGQPVVMAVARSWLSSSGAGSGLCASLLATTSSGSWETARPGHQQASNRPFLKAALVDLPGQL